MRIRDIAEQQRIPKKYLEAVLLELKKARLVQSIRGMRGGYQLRRAPADIRLSDIIPVRSAALLDIVRDARLRQLSERNAHYKAVYTVLL
jgi:Rrf2 family protein